jgi:hypothetical protein
MPKRQKARRKRRSTAVPQAALAAAGVPPGNDAEGPEPSFVDDPRSPRATPDSLDDGAAASMERGIQAVRDDDVTRDSSP